MIIDRVTMTGADDSIRPEAMREIAEEFPLVEWGILFSKSNTGNFRFPSFEWVDLLRQENEKKPMRLCAHICGRWVKDLLKGQATILDEHPGVLDMFQRVQLNFHAFPHDYDPDFCEKLPKGKQYIFQIEDVNDGVFETARKSGIDAVPLFDTSGGAGIVPDQWPPVIGGVYCGYAGGLGSETMLEQLGKIFEVNDLEAIGKRIWIDMERKIRSEDDAIFDLSKVKKCLALVNVFTKIQQIKYSLIECGIEDKMLFDPKTNEIKINLSFSAYGGLRP